MEAKILAVTPPSNSNQMFKEHYYWEAEAGESLQVQGQPKLQSETPSQKTEEEKKKVKEKETLLDRPLNYSRCWPFLTWF